VFAPIEVTRDLGDRSPAFNVAISEGRHLASATVVYGPVVNGGPTLTVDLTNAVLIELDVEQRATGNARETLALDYSKIKYTFTRSGQPSIVVEFDRGANTGGGGSIAGQYVYLGGLAPPSALGSAIPIGSFAHGISAPALSFSGGAAGKATHRDFSLQKPLDTETLRELGMSMTGAHSPNLFLALVRPDSALQPAEWFRYTLADVLVTSIALQTDGAGQLQETVSFGYRTIKWDFKPPGEAAQSGAWDLAANRSF
jgi:type VI secretion system Hcp family effector